MTSPQTASRIVRQPVRVDVRKTLIARLLSGELAPGTRIDEGALTAELGISRTPLREALAQLVQEGFLQAEMGRGCVVVPLTVEEVEETYPILRTLEGFALRSSDPADVLPTLVSLIEDMRKSSDDPDRLLEIDNAFHEALLSACPNRRLLELIGRLKQVAHRYEFAYMREQQLVTTSIDQHLAILQALIEHNMDRAAELLDAHWEFGMSAILDWLESETTTTSAS